MARRKAQKAKLTKRVVDAFSFDPANESKRQALWDTLTPGFGVRVFESGAKSFILTYRTGGRLRQMTIGRYGDLTVDQARAKARELRTAIREGEDPLATAAMMREAPTLADLAKVYIQRHAKPHKKTWKEDQQKLDKHILPRLGKKKLEAITRADLSQLHHRIGRTAPGAANRVLALLSVMFNKAVEWGFLEDGKPNPATRIKRYSERSRDRWVKPEEMPLLVEAIDAEENVQIRAAIKLYLLTGLRRGELLGLRWRDVDFNLREIRLEDTKAGRRHSIRLTDEMEAILRTLPPGIGNAYVFPGEDPRKPLVNIKKGWERIRARFWLAQNPDRAAELRAKAEATVARRSKHAEKSPEIVEAVLLQLAAEPARLEADLRLHDLRRTVGSWLAMDGASLPLIGAVLNHSNPSTTQIYARIAEDAAGAALERHSAKIGPMLGIAAGGGEG